MVSFSNFLQRTSSFAVPFLCMEAPKPSPLENTHFYNESYEEIVANLTPSQLEELESKLQGMPNPEIYKMIVNAIHSGVLTAEIFEIEYFDLYALLALRNKDIDGCSFSTSQLFYNGHRNNLRVEDKRFVPLFTDKRINIEAQHILLASALNDSLEHRKCARTVSEIATFFRQMEKTTAINQQFMLIPEKQTSSTMMGQLAVHKHRFKLLSHYLHLNGTTYRILPSKAMYQACLNCRGGEDTPLLISRFQLSPAARLKRQMLEKERDFCINFKGLPRVCTADDVECDPSYNEVELHDFLHGELVTSTPYAIRVKLHGLAEVCHGLASRIDNKDQKEFFHLLEEQFIDMEHYHFLVTDDVSVELKFWSILWLNVKDALFKTNPLIEYVPADGIFECFFLQATGDLLLQALIDQADELKRMYSLDLQGLMNLSKLAVDDKTSSEHLIVKKIALLLKQKITSRLTNKSLFKVAIGLESSPTTLIKARAWHTLKKQYIPSFFASM